MRFSHIAGDRFLDLVNTVDWRRSDEDREDRLAGFDDVIAWCEESQVVSGAEAAALRRLAGDHKASSRAELERVLTARELAYRGLFLADAEAAVELGGLAAAALGRAELVLGDRGWRWRERGPLAVTVPGDRIVRGLVELGERDDLDRLHQCEDAKCGWVYLDTSPRRNRRWCATSDCGDRNRARAYYARKKAAPTR